MPVERWDDEKIDTLANSVAELRLTASALLETVIIHQENFEKIIARMEQRDLEFDRMHSEIRGLQTENRRIFEILSRQQDNDNS